MQKRLRIKVTWEQKTLIDPSNSLTLTMLREWNEIRRKDFADNLGMEKRVSF